MKQMVGQMVRFDDAELQMGRRPAMLHSLHGIQCWFKSASRSVQRCGIDARYSITKALTMVLFRDPRPVHFLSVGQRTADSGQRNPKDFATAAIASRSTSKQSFST
jgi:hypothetical protein